MRAQTGLLSIRIKKVLLIQPTPHSLVTEGIHTLPLHPQEITEHNNALIIPTGCWSWISMGLIHGESNTKVILKKETDNPLCWSIDVSAKMYLF